MNTLSIKPSDKLIKDFRLIGQVVCVSLETVKLVKALPALNNAMTKEVSGQ